MKHFRSPETREAHRLGSRRGGLKMNDLRRAQKEEGMAAAIAWREGRRCHCGALAYEPCAHRPDGLHHA